MKKKLFCILVFCLLLTGCNKIEPFYLEDKYYEESGITEITVNELNKLEDDGESFLVFVYLTGCTSCSKFRTILESYSSENTLMFYSIEISNIKETSISKYVKYAPSLVLYKDGKIVTYLDSSKDEHIDYLETDEGFSEWLSNYILFKNIDK